MKEFCFIFPIDGDCLTEYDGKFRDGNFYVEVKIASESPILINGKIAEKFGKFYVLEVCIELGENTITAQCGNEFRQIHVYRLENCIGNYRVSSDDNILFLWDINRNKDTYTSIFDNSYLAMYKKMHDLYGAKVHLNLFYEIPDTCPWFDVKRGYFNLSMMTDCFKKDWQENSDWLKLNFHSISEEPECPYKDTDYGRIYEDCKKVHQEIIRFAGKESLSEETTIHYGTCTYEGVRAIRDLGIKNLAGYFKLSDGVPIVSYCYQAELVEHINKRDFWYDHDLDVRYAVIDNVMNLQSVKGNLDLLNRLYEKKGCAGFLEIMIHEQYYYKDYKGYIEEFEDIVSECCKWAFEKGYKGAFLSEVE